MKVSEKYSLWYQFRIIIIVLFTAGYMFFLWYTLIFWIHSYKNNIIENWNKTQTNAVAEAVESTKLIPFDNAHDFEKNVVDKIVKKINFSPLSYAFFYKEDYVIFEQNDELTNVYKGKTVRQIFEQWSYGGGAHLSGILEQIEQGKSGTDFYIKHHTKGKEYVSWMTFTRNDETYTLGIVTPEIYILNSYKFNKFSNDLIAISSIYTFILILFAISFCFSTYRYNKTVRELTQDLEKKEAQLVSLSESAKANENRLKSLIIRDPLTGAYNRRFIDRCLVKLEPANFIPVTVLMVDINGLRLINNTFGDTTGDELLKDIANTLNSLCTPNDIVTRYGNDEFLMVMANADEAAAQEVAVKLCNAISEKYWKRIPVSISVGIGSKTSEEGSVFDAVTEAENNLLKDKLSSEVSIRSSAVSMLKKILEERNIESPEHCERLKKYCFKLGTALQLTPKKIEELGLLAWLHDIGKIAIPDSILFKEGELTTYEMEIMRTHPELGYNIAFSSPDLSLIAKYILEHHERWDGTGYPQGLKGEEISLEARILAIVDAFDAIMSKKPDKSKKSVEEALQEIYDCAGTQFDPALAMKFIEIIKQEDNIFEDDA